MNQNQQINVELNLPPNVVATLNNINQTLNKLKKSATNTSSAFREIGSAAAAFNNINIAIGKLSVAKAALAVKQGLATKAMNKHFAASKVLELSTSGLTVKTLALTAAKGLATKRIGIMTAGKLLLASASKIAAGGIKALGVAVKIALGPIGWIIAAIGLLVAGIVVLVRLFTQSSEAYQKNREQVEQLQNRQEQLAGTFSDSATAFERNGKALEVHADRCRELVGTIENLSSVQNRSASQQRELERAVDTLNSRHEGLNLTYAQAGRLIENNADALREYVDAQNQVAQANHLIERQNQLYEEQAAKLTELRVIAARRQRIAVLLPSAEIVAGDRRICADIAVDQQRFRLKLCGVQHLCGFSCRDFVHKSLRFVACADAATAPVCAVFCHDFGLLSGTQLGRGLIGCLNRCFFA